VKEFDWLLGVAGEKKVRGLVTASAGASFSSPVARRKPWETGKDRQRPATRLPARRGLFRSEGRQGVYSRCLAGWNGASEKGDGEQGSSGERDGGGICYGKAEQHSRNPFGRDQRQRNADEGA
jgi:hypothetical protein